MNYRILLRKYYGFHLGHCAQLFYLQRACEEHGVKGFVVVSSSIPAMLGAQMRDELDAVGLQELELYWLAEGESLAAADAKLGIGVEVVHQMIGDGGGGGGGGGDRKSVV